MKNRQLGLPPEYQKCPEYFDAHNISADSDAKNARIERLLKTHNVKTVLDLTCGTGSQVFFLNQRGYEIVGADFSPALLTIAREKARKSGADVPFIDGDMRTIKVGKAGQFDAVITIANAIGHLTKRGFAKTLRNIHHHAKTGGIYIFDIFNAEAMTDSAVAGFAMHSAETLGDTQFHKIQYSTFNHANNRLTSYDYAVTQKNVAKPTMLRSTFALQLYTAPELDRLLDQNGFETLERYNMDGSPFIRDKTISMLTVARKK